MKLKHLIVAAVMTVASAVPAAANTITPTFISAVLQGGGDYLWTYEAYLTNGRLDADAAATDEFFTIYDIQGYVSGSGATSNPGSWSVAESLLGSTPTGQTPVDAASLMNLTFRYTDTTALTHSGAVAPVLLGQFTFLSTVGAFNLNGVYTSQDLPVNPANSTPQTSNGFLTVPAPDGGWTLAMLGSALVGFGLLRRRFRLN